MFSPEEIKARLGEKPFRPLRIIASEGQAFDVHHPDLVLVGRRDLTIGIAGAKHPTIYDRITRVALVHVVALEDLAVPAKPDKNGEQWSRIP